MVVMDTYGEPDEVSGGRRLLFHNFRGEVRIFDVSSKLFEICFRDAVDIFIKLGKLFKVFVWVCKCFFELTPFCILTSL